jgi:MFS family permease
VFGVTDSQIGLVITAYTVPGIFLTPFVGLAADRFGRRAVLVPLLFVFGIAGAGVALARTFTEVLILRFVQGIGASALVTIAVTLIGDLYDGDRRDAVMGLNGSTVGTGAAIYPVVGGTLAALWWGGPFLFFGIGVLVGIFAVFALGETDDSEPTDLRTYFASLGEVIVLPQALAIFTAIFVVFVLLYGAVLTALPLLLSDEFGLESGSIGLLLAMVSLASAIVSSQFGRISNWRSPTQLVSLGFVAYGSSLIGLWLAPSPLYVGVSLLAFGAGIGITLPSIDTAIVTIVSSRLRAGMMGMRTSVLRLGQTVGPIAFTFTAETAFETPLIGYRWLLAGVGSLVSVIGVVMYFVTRHGSEF